MSLTLASRVSIATTATARLPTLRKSYESRARLEHGRDLGDCDGDGRLDLFVPGYVEIDLDNLPRSPAERAQARGRGAKTFVNFAAPRSCAVRAVLTGESDTLYHQKPDGTFDDVSVKAGVNDPQKYYGFASAFVQANEDE